jgi:hypothetical protein
MTSSAEALVLAQQVDTVVLLGVGDETKTADVRSAVENLRLVRDGQVWTALVTTSLLGRLSRLARFRGAGAAVTPSSLALEAARPQPALAPVVGV